MKGQTVAESYSGDVSASEIARREGIVPSQLFAWRRQAHEGKFALPVDDDMLFAPVLVEDTDAAPSGPPSPANGIEIDVSGVIIQLPLDTPAVRLVEIVRALRGAS